MDWQLVRNKAAEMVEELVYKAPDLKERTHYPRCQNGLYDVMPIRSSYHRRQQVKNIGHKQLTDLAQFYLQLKKRLPSGQVKFHDYSAGPAWKITDLYGRYFRMRISLSPSSLDRRDISFQVSSIFPIPTADTGAQKNIASRFDGQSHTLLHNLDKTIESTVHCQQAEDAALGSKLLDEKQDTISLSLNVKCTPPPLQTPCSAERKTYKRSRDDEDQGTASTEEGISLPSIGKEKAKAVTKLKFDATAKEKQDFQRTLT